MEKDLRTRHGLDHAAIDEEGTVNDNRQVRRKDGRGVIAGHPEKLAAVESVDVVSVLPEGQQDDLVPVIPRLDQQPVLGNVGAQVGRVGGVDLYFNENEDAVVAEDHGVADLRPPGAVDVKYVVHARTPLHRDAVDHDGLLAVVIDLHDARGAAPGGEDGIEGDRVGGVAEFHVVTGEELGLDVAGGDHEEEQTEKGEDKFHGGGVGEKRKGAIFRPVTRSPRAKVYGRSRGGCVKPPNLVYYRSSK